MAAPKDSSGYCRKVVWNYNIDWTPDHLSQDQLRTMIHSYDELATECLESFDKLAPAIHVRARAKTAGGTDETKVPAVNPHSDLYEILVKHKDTDPKLHQLWQQVTTIPDWVDWDQIDRGQQVFYRYAGPAIISLTFQSLLGGMGSNRVVETLTRTGGFGAKVTRRRLLETFQHVLDVTRDLDSVKPGGKGFVSSIRVRLLHASVRRRIMNLVKERPSYYDVAAYGVPINDLDSVGTVNTFSAALIWVGFPRQGIYLREREIADYIALWRWVAHILGTPTEPFSSPALAKLWLESLMASEISPSPTGQILANNIITGLESQPPTYASANFLRAQTHWLNGHALADALAVPRAPLYYSILIAGQCFFFVSMCYVTRLVPGWDARNIANLRRLLHAETLKQTDEREALHEFQYIPQFGQMTALGDAEKRKGGFWATETSIERRNLRAAAWAVLAAGATVWLCVRGVVGMQHVASGMLQTIGRGHSSFSLR